MASAFLQPQRGSVLPVATFVYSSGHAMCMCVCVTVIALIQASDKPESTTVSTNSWAR